MDYTRLYSDKLHFFAGLATEEPRDEFMPLDGRSVYLNRELSWLEFNKRVLEEARDPDNPLAERLNFLSIVSSNLDEFFMIRVAALHDQVQVGFRQKDPSGLTPAAQLDAMSEMTHEMVKRQYSTFNRALIPALEKENVRLLRPDQLDARQLEHLSRLFDEEIFPVLTPMAIDASHPFPLIANRTINLIVRIDSDEPVKPAGKKTKKQKPDYKFAVVQIPNVLSRIERLPSAPDESAFILLEDIVRIHLSKLFSGVRLGASACFRIMRNADLDIDEEEAADLLSEIESQLKQRQWGEVIRLEAERGLDAQILSFLMRSFGITEKAVYEIRGPLDLTFAGRLRKALVKPEHFYEPFAPQPNPHLSAAADLFAVLRERDVFLHHPYESFDPVVRLIQTAAHDPEVLAIKQTLYRVSGTSPIIQALAQAAENGKQVFVLVELKARFDEENNIVWAKRLEKAGCHVIYGLMGLKTHSKITLIVRREGGGIRRYVHLGTGNYNDITAKIYTDMAILTSREAYGRDATDFFNMISGYSLPLHLRRIVTAPRWLKNDTLEKIRRETAHARNGKAAGIIAKVNALVDTDIIDALYEASAAGVSIDLIVRGICCLRPGIKDLSEHIRVRSLIGRYLEHSRIFYYYNDGNEEIYLSSADWMPRNLERRIEILFPVEDQEARNRVKRVLEVELLDTDRAWLMHANGSYAKVDRRRFPAMDSQNQLMEDALFAAGVKQNAPYEMDRYIPRTTADHEKYDSSIE